MEQMILQLPNIIQTRSFIFKNYTVIPEEDSRVLWQVRNDDQIRCYMENSEKFSWESHCKFVQSLTSRTNAAYFAVYGAFDGGGVIASQSLNPIDLERAEAESGQYVLPTYQGKGLGSQMKKEFFEYLFDNGFKRIVEKVKKSNTRNQHIDENLGMTNYSEDCEYAYYELRVLKSG